MKSKYKSGYAKKQYYKKKKRYANKAVMGKSIGFPNNNVVKMRYVTYASITSNGTSFGKVQFRANSINDPDYTYVGGRPFTYATWATLYNHYHVISSKISAQVSAVSTLAFPAMAGIYLSDDPTIYSAWETCRESGRGTQIQMPIASTIAIKNLYCSFNSKKFFGHDELDSVQASMTTDPAEEAYYTIYVQSLDRATSIANQIGVTITIDYLVRLGEPKDLAASS